MLDLLLKNGANIWQKDADDWLALHFAALVGWDAGIQLLLKTFKDRRKARVSQLCPAAEQHQLVGPDVSSLINAAAAAAALAATAG